MQSTETTEEYARLDADRREQRQRARVLVQLIDAERYVAISADDKATAPLMAERFAEALNTVIKIVEASQRDVPTSSWAFEDRILNAVEGWIVTEDSL